METITADDAAASEEQAQFREAFVENLHLVLDILDVMRGEAVHMHHWQEAGFVASVEEALAAFARTQPMSGQLRRG